MFSPTRRHSSHWNARETKSVAMDQWTAIQLPNNCVKRARDSIKRKYLIRILLKIVKQRRRRYAFAFSFEVAQKRNETGRLHFKCDNCYYTVFFKRHIKSQLKRYNANLRAILLKCRTAWPTLPRAIDLMKIFGARYCVGCDFSLYFFLHLLGYSLQFLIIHCAKSAGVLWKMRQI